MSELAIAGADSLEPLTAARQIVARAVADRDHETLFELRDRAAAYQHYYERRAEAKDTANDAGEIKVRAERGLGQIDAAENPRGRPRKDDGAVNFSLGIREGTRAAWRKFGDLSEERFEQFVDWAREDEDAGVSTARLVEYLRTGSQGASVTFECYTPAEYVEAARQVLGAIDLDPASSAEANETVKAARFFTAEDDGLTQEWRGRVFLNPPYGRALTGQFVTKLIEERNARRISQAIVLLNAYGFDAAWFRPLWDGLLCFTNHRIRFYGGGPTFGSLFVYLGPRWGHFEHNFRQFGEIVRRA